MKHSNDGGVLKGAHEYKNGSYVATEAKHTEYPKAVGNKVFKSAEEEAAHVKAEAEKVAAAAEKVL
jgi:hypothetical protein